MIAQHEDVGRDRRNGEATNSAIAADSSLGAAGALKRNQGCGGQAVWRANGYKDGARPMPGMSATLLQS